MEPRRNNIVFILVRITTLLKAILETLNLQQRRNSELWNKNQVIERLQISDSTYRRYVKEGLLLPMKLHGIDLYYPEDLEKSLLLSRQKGRF